MEIPPAQIAAFSFSFLLPLFLSFLVVFSFFPFFSLIPLGWKRLLEAIRNTADGPRLSSPLFPEPSLSYSSRRVKARRNRIKTTSCIERARLSTSPASATFPLVFTPFSR